MKRKRRFLMSAAVADSEGTVWTVSFHYPAKAGCYVNARNTKTGEEFTDLRNYDLICEVLPLDCWPAFAVKKEDNTQKERLF